MGWWNYTNIGASAKPENKKHVEKIFEYIGYASEPGFAPDGEECSFLQPDVYYCEYSDYERESGNVKKAFESMEHEDLLNLLNALFSKTDLYIHTAKGNNTNDTWENHDTVYNTRDMTCYCDDSYTSYDCGPRGKRSSKARFALKPPEAKYVDALIKLATKDQNEQLLKLLQDLSEKLKAGLIVYKEKSSDKRKVGEKYDIEDNVSGEGYDDWDDDEEDEDEDLYPIAITDENEKMDILENSRCSTLANVKVKIADREKMDNDVLALVRRFPRLWEERNEWDEGYDYWIYSHLNLITEEDEDEGLFWFVDMDEELSNFGCSFYEFAKILAKYAKSGSTIPLETGDYGKAQVILEDGMLSLWTQHEYKQK